MAPGEGKLIGLAILRTLYLAFVRAFIPVMILTFVFNYFCVVRYSIGLLRIPLIFIIISIGYHLYFKGFVRCNIFLSEILMKMSDLHKKHYKYYTAYLNRVSYEMRSLIAYKFPAMIFSFTTVAMSSLTALIFFFSRGM